MSDEQNKRIYEWLHPDTEVLVLCEERPYQSDSEYVGKHVISMASCPKYFINDGFFALLAGLKSLSVSVTLSDPGSHGNPTANLWKQGGTQG